MNIIADFHVHSKYSRATARNLDLENLYVSAQLKGINVVGTGDFTHPAWFQEIVEKLVPAEDGLFRLKPEMERVCDERVPAACRRPVRFILVTEISNIYKKAGFTRKNHNLVFLPNTECAERFNRRLDAIGNIQSDGRPILGLDARNLLEIVLEMDPLAFLVPAHIWTPWFSLLGSKSGFDSVQDCFEDLSHHIFALETGLSSDPPMNRRVSGLDRFSLISNSDAHSPSKLGREANRFETDLDFAALRGALDGTHAEGFLGTIEFFPEEGKYHIDGHRQCHFRCLPAETRLLNNICPVCNAPLVLGVLNRVEQLADRPGGTPTEVDKPFRSLIPLEEVLAEVLQCGSKTKAVAKAYQKLLTRLGPEYHILDHAPQETIARCGIPLLDEAIVRMRTGRISFDPGFDGVYGQVRIFNHEERASLSGKQSLFIAGPEPHTPESAEPTIVPNSTEPILPFVPPGKRPVSPEEKPLGLNIEQQAAVHHSKGPLLIVAGPGTGKTLTITRRMADLISKGTVSASGILAVTFTHKAAREMKLRLDAMVPTDREQPTVGTFHAVCLRWLKERTDHPTTILDDAGRTDIMADAMRLAAAEGCSSSVSVARALDFISKAKQNLLAPGDDKIHAFADDATNAIVLSRLYRYYQQLLEDQRAVDFEDLIFHMVRYLRRDNKWQRELRGKYAHVFVDEFQDLNYSQYALMRLLVPADGNVCAIGDPDQAIYGFRGADANLFQRFFEDYPSARIIQLDRNYRSTQTIVQAAGRVIQEHPVRLSGYDRPSVRATTFGGKTIAIVEAPTARSEAVVIGKAIEQMVGGTGFYAIDSGTVGQTSPQRAFSDFGVLYRTADQGAVIAEVLTRAGIPCQLATKERLVRKPGVVKLLALLRVMVDGGTYPDMNHLRHLAHPGISKQTLNTFKTWAHLRRMPLGQALLMATRMPIEGLSASRQHQLVAQVRVVRDLAEKTSGWPMARIIPFLLAETQFANQLDADDLNFLLDLASSDGRETVGFWTALSDRSDTDLYRPEVQKVALMTMHAAKGLEFPVVFIAGCENGLIPYQRTMNPAYNGDPLEERRLFYVAMTRAREQLYLVWALKRRRFGKTRLNECSPFVKAIQQHLLEYTRSAAKRSPQRQLSLF